MKQLFTFLSLFISIVLVAQQQIGSDIDGEALGDQSGSSISLSSDGSVVAIGAPFNDGNGSNSGHVRVYENISGTWSQIGSDIDGEASGDNSGSSVSLSSDGSVVAIGAPFNDGNGPSSAHVRVYKNISGAWSQIGSDIDGEASGDTLGSSISLSSDGSVVAIGASGNDENGANSGHVRVYENQSGTWIQIGIDIDGEASGDNSGSSVSLSSDGSIVAIGAHFNENNTGHVRVYNLSTLSVEETDMLEFYKIYPNPTSSTLNIELPNPSELKKVFIYNNLGQLITEQTNTKINVSNFSKGLYFAEIITNNGDVTKKFIVE